MQCLHAFSRDDLLKKHVPHCSKKQKAQAIEMPTEENNILKFTGIHLHPVAYQCMQILRVCLSQSHPLRPHLAIPTQKI